MIKVFFTLLTLTISLAVFSCGSNVFEGIDPAEPAEEATVALEEQKPDKAIQILENALRADPENPTLLSLLASAKAQLAGVDTIDLALSMISSESSAESEANDIEKLFAVMPAATLENIQLLSESVEIMNTIPAVDQLNSDRFKLSMFFTSLMTLRTKFYDADGDGQLGPEELLELDDEAAVAILEDLFAAETSLANNQNDGENGGVADKVSAIRSKIDTEEGASDAERLRNFLSR
ncbi:MAG: tetratricopeptide repeat protein [Oligoflexus sp.]